MNETKITTIGNSLGVVLPRDALAKLKVGRGDRLLVIDTAYGIELTPYDPEVARQLDAAEAIMRDDRDVLRKLAE